MVKSICAGLVGFFIFTIGLPAQTHAQAANAVAADASKLTLKHKVAIGRFTNETRYGKSLLRDRDLDPLGKQALDILSAYLTQTEKFLVFERPDLSKIEREKKVQDEATSVVGVNALILGSIVEFGRTEAGTRGWLNKERVQRAHAKVAIRLVDVRTGAVFHSATGQGEATTETKTVLGIGSTSDFDGTLTDKAISAAIEDMLEELVNTLSGRKWETDILDVQGSNIFIAGGQRQGLSVGDRLIVSAPGKTIKSGSSGFDITLPSKPVATLEIVSLFGDSEMNEGSVTRLVDGSLSGLDFQSLVVGPGGA